jgi:hypothetical protein
MEYLAYFGPVSLGLAILSVVALLAINLKKSKR